MPKVSVIIPVYGVESYIERCARSLFEQTLDDIEFLFIDDCTPDKSVDILNNVLQEYPNRKNQVTIHRMEHNSGQALVRKWGMLNATGDYVIHCDSDDWVNCRMYEELYLKAQQECSDVVVCDFCRTDGTTHLNVCGCHSTTPLTYVENCLFQKDHWSLCNKLFSRKCLEGLVYPSGALGEDMMMCMQMLGKCRVVSYVGKTFYYYFYNSDSITKKKTIKQCEDNFYTLKVNTDFVLSYIDQNFSSSDIDVELAGKYLRMVNIFSLLPVKHITKYKDLWRDYYVKMPLRFYFSDKISSYNKIVYVLSSLGLFPFKKDRAI